MYGSPMLTMLTTTLKFKMPIEWGEGPLDNITRMSESMTNITTIVKSGISLGKAHYPEATISLQSYRFESDIKYSVSISAVDENQFYSAVSDFIGIAGIPIFVYGGYDAVLKALSPYDKTLKRKFKGGGVGKFVVDA